MHLWWPMNGAEERMAKDDTKYYPMHSYCSSELKNCAGGLNGRLAASYYAEKNYDYANKLLAKYHDIGPILEKEKRQKGEKQSQSVGDFLEKINSES
jgi:hypothetical protein